MTDMPRVNQGNKRHASLDDYFQDAATIWEQDRSERTVLDLWLHPVDHAARVVEAVRKERPIEVIDELAATAMWLFTFLAKCRYPTHELDQLFRIDLDPSDLIWNKYPGMCPACFDFLVTEQLQLEGEAADRVEEVVMSRLPAIRANLVTWARQYSRPATCMCLTRIGFAEERHGLFGSATSELNGLRLEYARLLREAGHKPVSVSGIEEMFWQIFQNSYAVLPIERIAFHLLEEVGEATQALKGCYTFETEQGPWSSDMARPRVVKLEEELADVFSWLFATLLKIRLQYADAQKYIDRLVGGTAVGGIVVTGNITFSEVIWSSYGRSRSGEIWEVLKCPGCETRPCRCPRKSVLWIPHRTNGQRAPILGESKATWPSNGLPHRGPRGRPPQTHPRRVSRGHP